ncbi:MAG: response regulator [Anaerolineae bacterium]|nr:response regulator [Anaerolineae bacterium]
MIRFESEVDRRDFPGGKVTNSGITINLDSLRTELAARLAVLVIAAAAIGAWLCIPLSPFPQWVFTLLTLLLIHALIVRRMLRERPALSRRLLVAGWLILLLAAMILIDQTWLPYLGLLVTFVSAVLVRRSEIVVAAATALMAYGLEITLGRSYALPQSAIILLFGAAAAWIASSTVYTALEWESQARERSHKLLTEIREHRAQLSQSVKMLNQAHELQMRTQQQLIWARKAAEEARRVKEQFAANISHELRTPLNLVLGFAAVMYKNPEVYGEIAWPMKLRRDISHVYRNTSHLVELVDDILDLSRIEIASFALNLEPTPLAPLLQEVTEIAGDLFNKQGVQFVVEIEGDLPSLDIDRTRIRQVLLNLLNNAYKFTEQGSIRLWVRKSGESVDFKIIDTGVGVAADKLPHLFEEFYQVDSSLRRSRPGAGLGLAISKRFVVAHGGQIGVESVEGVGTTVFFSLPLRHPMLALSPPKPPNGAFSRLPRLLLLNADRYTAARLAHDMKQYEIIALDDIQDINEAVKTWEPRAILRNNISEVAEGVLHMDYTLPVPVIDCPLVIAPYDSRDTTPFELLPKPITSEQLLEKLDAYGSPRRILVVDDDIGFTQLIERFLETSHREYDIIKAYNAREGLETMRATLPDLVLLDIVMPDLNGFQMVDIILEDSQLRDIPVILLAASDRPTDSEVVIGRSICIHNAIGFRAGEIVHLLGRILDDLTAPRSR